MNLELFEARLKTDALPLLAIRGIKTVCLLSSVLLGCASLDRASYTAPVAEDVRSAALTVAIISTVVATDDTIHGLDAPIGQEKEAVKGAVTGTGTGLLAGVLVSIAGGPLGPILAPIVIPVFTVGGMASGTAIGWSNAIPERDAVAASAALSRPRSELSAELARRIRNRLPSVGKIQVSPDGIESPDLSIEVSIDRWGLAGGAGSDPLTGLFVEASYLVAKGPDNTTLANRRFIQGGPQRTISEWTRDNAALLSKAVDQMLSLVAEAVADGVFRVHDFRVLEGGGGPVRGETCGLRPVSPPPIYRFGPYESGPPRVNSLTPDLVWESFPGKKEFEDDTTGILARVSEVRYDLRVWKNEYGGPGDVVYERTGLKLTSNDGRVDHILETPLASSSSYHWSVRARFRLDGAERVTRWAYDLEYDRQAIPLGFSGKHGWLGAEDPYRQSLARRRTCLEDSIPPLHYFSFNTPRD
jgi:hypothetical protein